MSMLNGLHDYTRNGGVQMTQKINVKRLNDKAVLPTKAHVTDSGFDLYVVEDVVIEPGETVIVKTGLAFELPPGYEMQIRPRSGVTTKTKLRVALGTVDAGYNGEVGVIVDHIGKAPHEPSVWPRYIDGKEAIGVNLLDGEYIVKTGDRIAQAVITKLPEVQLTEVSELGESARGNKGYGSSGVSYSDSVAQTLEREVL